jgi:hypothetical protein
VTPTTIPRQHVPRRKTLRGIVNTEVGAIVLAAALALAVGPPMTSAPRFVDSVSIVNPSGYDIRVRATGADRDGWIALGTAQDSATRNTLEVIDQGDRWIFWFTVGGRDGGELEVSRDDLSGDDWTIEVPATVIQQLDDLGAPPSP